MFIRVKALSVEESDATRIVGDYEGDVIRHDLVLNINHVVTAEDIDEVTTLVSFVSGEQAVVDMPLGMFFRTIGMRCNNGQ